MKKQRVNQGSSDFIDNDVFADFDPPQTTDGGYKGTMKRIKATEDHLQRKFEEKLEEVKARLKASKCRVGLKVTGGTIQLQATLPPKPDSDKAKPYQQLISLSIPASLDGLKTSEEEANELGRLLARKQFEWNEKYLGSKIEEIKVPTIGEALSLFEDTYFQRRQKNNKSEYTLFSYRSIITTHFDMKDSLDQLTVETKILAINSPSSRHRSCVAIKMLAKSCNILIDTKGLSSRVYEKKTRNIPSDKQIIDSFGLFEKYGLEKIQRMNIKYRERWKLFRWAFGMLATYGLRPRELFLKPNIEWWLSPENTDSTWKVHKDNKTGEREAFPLHQDWVELFDLKNPFYIDLLTEKLGLRNSFSDFKKITTDNAQWFVNVGLNFQPYDLRHAWAIRAHMLGIPIKVSADNLGHSAEIHMSTYQKWLGRDNRKNAINAAIAKKSEVDLLKEEVIRLTLECDRLKMEVNRYKLMVENPELLDR